VLLKQSMISHKTLNLKSNAITESARINTSSSSKLEFLVISGLII
jgi:hypothetical protein